MKKSAYFPSSAENSVAKGGVNAPNKQQDCQRGLVPVVHSGGISFPYSASVLWNRDPISFPKNIAAQDTLPPVLLTADDISHVLQRLLVDQSNLSGDLRVSATHYHNLSDERKDMIGCPVLGIPRYLLCTGGNIDEQLTIPISKHPDIHTLAFEESSTLNLVQNLGKSVRSGREFSMKSCVRIRAAGFATRSTSACKSSAGTSGGRASSVSTLTGTVRIEAIIPNISFQAVQVNPIPILATPLAKHLTSRSSSIAEDAPKMGYLTLNQVRKLVTLQETDTSVPLVPLVGVWVKFGNMHTEPEVAATLLEHPFVWGACVRFLCCDHIQERVHVARDTFLLTLIVGDNAEYYEVSKVFGGADTSSDVCLSKGTDFLCSDFTVDLSTSLLEDGSPVQREGDAVICRFRPLVRPEHLPAHQQRTGSPNNGSAPLPPAQQQYPITAPATDSQRPLATMQQPPAAAASNLLYSRTEASSIESESQLAPRGRCPQPMQAPVSPAQLATSDPLRTSTAPSYMSSLYNAQSMEMESILSVDASGQNPQQRFAELFQSPQGQDVLRLSAVLSTGPTGANNTSAVDLVRAQQKQIQQLCWQVEELRQMVLQLGGRLPGEHFLRSSAARDEPVSLRASHASHRPEQQVRGSTNGGIPWTAESKKESADPLPAAASRLVPPEQFPINDGADDASESSQYNQHYSDEDFEMDERSDDADSPNSAESDLDGEGGHEQQRPQDPEREHEVIYPDPDKAGKFRPSPAAPVGVAQRLTVHRTPAKDYPRSHESAQSAKSSNTGIGAAEMDSICVSASYSGTSHKSSTYNSSYSAPPRGGLAAVSKWAGDNRTASRINKLLDHEEDHPTFMESESILQIQARYS